MRINRSNIDTRQRYRHEKIWWTSTPPHLLHATEIARFCMMKSFKCLRAIAICLWLFFYRSQKFRGASIEIYTKASSSIGNSSWMEMKLRLKKGAASIDVVKCCCHGEEKIVKRKIKNCLAVTGNVRIRKNGTAHHHSRHQRWYFLSLNQSLVNFLNSRWELFIIFGLWRWQNMFEGMKILFTHSRSI